jgi:hypothetical protein
MMIKITDLARWSLHHALRHFLCLLEMLLA